LPSHAAAVLGALRFDASQPDHLARLSTREWRQALSFCNRTQLTLALAVERYDSLPDAVRSDMDRHLANNAERWQRIKVVYGELASALAHEGLAHVVLKGFSHCPLFVRDPRHRAQGDLDLLLPREQLHQARNVAERLGYEAIAPAF
jgi:hypothetical protein